MKMSARKLFIVFTAPCRTMYVAFYEIFISITSFLVTDRGTAKQRITYDYKYDDRTVCQTVFMTSHDTTIGVLKAIQKQLKSTGPAPRIHKSTG